MAYRSLRACVDDLDRASMLRKIQVELSADLEIPEITRRVYEAGGPALLFEKVAGTRFPALSNLFGTMPRARYIFRDTFRSVQRAIELRAHPETAMRRPWQHISLLPAALTTLPRQVSSGPVLANQCRLSELPQIRAWPRDGGAFITLPQVYSEDLDAPGTHRSNLGMYRVQLAGNDYVQDHEVGLHYQIHRGIGVHHAKAIARGQPLRVSIFVGGPPAHTLAAVMPLPEGLSELVFAGLLGGHRFRYARREGHMIATDADFCIVGTIDGRATKPEGPFGDHLGYYSLQHDFPVMRVERVYHRKDAIWPFTVVGRPPQEDTTFGELIHELTAPMVPVSVPGLVHMHAVDAAGVHPLLLAIGKERYVPYRPNVPQELLTVANAVLGFGQASLAKYLWIIADNDDDVPDIADIGAFFQHALRRVDFRRDLHFHTRTTIDTLDYTGSGLNSGSKLVVAACGKPIRSLDAAIPSGLRLPDGFSEPRIVVPGVVALRGPAHSTSGPDDMRRLADMLHDQVGLDKLPLWTIVDDSDMTSRSLRNWLWVTFTRSNPASDTYGAGERIEQKHWGCAGPFLIDARIKSHHAPPLVEDPAITKRVDALAAPGGPLHGLY